MRVAIMTKSANSFHKPMAEGLQRMFTKVGVESDLFYDGLRRLFRFSTNADLKSIVYTSLNYFGGQSDFLNRLSNYDMIIVVAHLPNSFIRNYYNNIEFIRNKNPDIIIVNYDLVYLLTRGPWLQWLKAGNPEKGVSKPQNFGMERYDWYLVASFVSEYALPQTGNPFHCIGLNLDDGSLYPEDKEKFIAIVDFERTDHVKEREIQIRALEETNTEYLVLKGRYPIAEIRKLYRKACIYFLAHRESFGLPICELQACGSYIFTPYPNWCPSHWLKDNFHTNGEGQLSSNFVVYDNDLNKLKSQIENIKKNYNKDKVFQTFIRHHPQLFYGDTHQLEEFLNKVNIREIHSKSHISHKGLSAAV